jgi:integrase
MGTEERRNRDFSKGPVWDETRARWLVEIRYPDGSRRRSRFRREREASRAWSSEQTKIESGGWHEQAPKNMTFGALLDLYRAHAKVHVPSYASYTAPALKVWEAGIPGDTPLARVTPTLIDAVKIKRAEKVQKCSVDRNLQVLRRLFNWAIEQGLATDNPMRRVKFFRADTKRLRYLTEEDYRRLLEEAAKIYRSPFLREAIELAVHTGLRRGNLLGLQWDWVDWLNRVVRVPRTKSGKPHALPLSATAYAALERLWAAHAESPYVFAHATGAHAGAAVRDLKKGFHTAVENAGLEDLRWHDLRHTFASWLVMRGASLRAVSELLGHQTMQMTLRYAHLSPGFLSTEIKLLDGPDDRRGGKRARKGQRAPKGLQPRSRTRRIVKESGAPCRTRTCDLLVRSWGRRKNTDSHRVIPRTSSLD